ncbi:hypothetical protein EV213_102102 [Aureibacillus halotolerans]|uniref:Uncharacterized protein n=1 Tax=Aureibacillus halotolerans TaxID=1508390 RepID=A0A4R6UAJ8_9BACI|nr:hypothetical protein EV213_102102 [Aureibacillus halotolerans]
MPIKSDLSNVAVIIIHEFFFVLDGKLTNKEL